ncbi:MAG: histidine phosphatase family protein [Saprospiraceae bacterium]|nr:histidine phosphatase family protein [Saprospiraceae bacterium]
MKKVIIIRHAKSSWNDFNLSDFDRPLDSRGLRDAPLMAERLKKAGHIPQILISSNALRAKTTANYFSTVFDLDVRLVPSLYHGQPDDYLNVITELEEDIKTVALFGHNPGITYIANLIKPGCTDNIPTCGIIVATLSDMMWEEADWNKMTLTELMYPIKN